MTPRRLRLKDGVGPDRAAETLRELVAGAGNIVASMAPGDVSAEVLPRTSTQARRARFREWLEQDEPLRDRYVQWVERAEGHLSNLTTDQEALAMLQTQRYWHIRELSEGSARPSPLVQAEIKFQQDALERLARDLKERAERFSKAPGHITVLDTNILLEFQPPGQIDWAKVMKQSQDQRELQKVRLLVPMRVVEELDAKKYARRDDLADRARRALQQLESVMGAGGEPGELGSSVTIEVPVNSGSRRRPADADEEILETCEELRQLTGREVTLVTADTAMRLRAQGRSIPVVRIPAEYERRRVSEASQVGSRESPRGPEASDAVGLPIPTAP